mgnify:CR=1 FL=1
MAFEHKNNSGSMFKNDYATTEKHPAMKGTALIDGKLWQVAAWTNIGTRNDPAARWQSLSFEVKDASAANRSQGPAPAPAPEPPPAEKPPVQAQIQEEFNDDIPF